MPAGQASALARWQLPDFSAPEAPSEPPPPAPPTAAQLDAIEAAAYEEGYGRGRTEGKIAGAGEAKAQAQRLAALFDHLAKPLAELDAAVESALVALAVQVGRRLAQHELSLEPSRLAAIVGEAVSALATVPRELRVLLNPEDAQLLKDSLPAPPDVAVWRIVADPALSRGDCRIAGESGWIDGTLETRTAMVAQALHIEQGAAQ
jgi:flagellar assembly protein FliH